MLKGFITVVSANHRKAIVHLQHRNWQYRNLSFMMEWWDGKKQAHYTGKLESGQVFDSSYNRGKPLTFRIGVGEVISGWDQGILGTDGIPPMLAGGKRTLRIPPQLAYGDRGAGCRLGSCLIPPNSTLLFDVEFVGKA
jgi:peptidylprolyl isomerase